MLNEPVGEAGDAPEVGDMGAAGEEGAPVNYIQVTPQEKEAIERVSGQSRSDAPVGGDELSRFKIPVFVICMVNIGSRMQ